MGSLYIENLSNNSVQVLVNNTFKGQLNTGTDLGINNIANGDILQLSNSNGGTALKLDVIAGDYSNLSIINDANNKFSDNTVTQQLGVNTSVVYSSNSPLYMSFQPTYFVKLTGDQPGTFQQVDGTKYLVSVVPIMPKSHWYFVLIILFIIIIIVVAYFGYKHFSSLRLQL